MKQNVVRHRDTLSVVPAVHGRAAFALAIREAACSLNEPPDAIAVELGQCAVDAIVKWMRELGVGSSRSARVPCMVGLVRRNRMIHPTFRDAAMDLQEESGLPLSHIPTHLLNERIEFAGTSLICLSTTDSIVEGIRCAVENSVPVYGVDLEEFAIAKRTPTWIEAPPKQSSEIADFAANNSRSSAGGADRWVDHRREQFMVANLKHLATRHRRVLFTCGIGHWDRLKQLLDDPSLVPMAELPAKADVQYARVLVDPLLAIQQMDVLPEITTFYETVRRSNHAPEALAEVYQGVWPAVMDSARAACIPTETSRLVEFFQFLSHMSLVGEHRLPSISDCTEAGAAMVSKEFGKRMGEALLRRNMEWADPTDWPGLPVVMSSGVHTPSEKPVRGVRARLIQPDTHEERLIIDSAMDSQVGSPTIPLNSPVADSLSKKRKEQRPRRSAFGNMWAWHPQENLLYGSAYRAASYVYENTVGQMVEPFAGSMHDGVDIKSTLRSFAKNENKVHVRRAVDGRDYGYRQAMEEPVVILFSNAKSVTSGSWDVARAADDLSPFLKDQKRYDEVVKERGQVFIANVALSETTKPEERLRDWVRTTKVLWGVATFGNPSNSNMQAARWAEQCDYARFPILQNDTMRDLTRYYKAQFDIELESDHWTSKLIRIGLPYARKRLIVIAPAEFRVPTELRREAAKRKVEIELVPHAMLPKEELMSARKQHYVESIDGDGVEFWEDLEMTMGESIDARTELLPEWVRKQRLA